MERREFLSYAATAAILPYLGSKAALAGAQAVTQPDPRLATYASPKEAMNAARETGVFVTALHTGTGGLSGGVGRVSVSPFHDH